MEIKTNKWVEKLANKEKPKAAKPSDKPKEPHSKPVNSGYSRTLRGVRK